jgi:hypothetical protein
VTMRHIVEVIQLPEKCLILTDSMSSYKTLLSRKISHRIHLLVYKCKQMCSELLGDGVGVDIMWIPSYVGLEGTTCPGAVFDKPLPPVDFKGLARSVLLR